MFSLKVEWVATSDNATVTEFIKVQDELQANRWLDAIAKYGTILEVNLVPVA
jgi:hypothetical protein